MPTFIETERREWEILNDVSMNLTKLVMEHSNRKAEKLKSTELVKTQGNSTLCELEKYENKN